MKTIELLARLDNESVTMLAKGAKAATKAEKKSMAHFDSFFAALEQKTIDAIMRGEESPPDVDFTPLLIEMAYNAMEAAITTTPRLPKDTARLGAKNPENKIPSNPRELRIWWDLVRHRKAPKRIQELEKKIKREYLEKTQSIWSNLSKEFREGKVWNQDLVKEQIRKVFASPKNRARVITRTETTRYFNDARASYYDHQPTVTHYLFISIRDNRTTEWCKDRQGLVYDKTSDYYKREKPPIHYQCRSEMVPLSPFNPRHKLLISDEKIQRENNHPKPLMKGWNES